MKRPRCAVRLVSATALVASAAAAVGNAEAGGASSHRAVEPPSDRVSTTSSTSAQNGRRVDNDRTPPAASDVTASATDRVNANAKSGYATDNAKGTGREVEGAFTLPMAPVAGSDLLRKLLPKLLSADVDAADVDAADNKDAAQKDDMSDKGTEELRRLASYLGLLPSSPSSSSSSIGVYGLLDEIIVAGAAEDAPEEDGFLGEKEDEDGLHHHHRRRIRSIDQALLSSLGLAPNAVALHNDRVRPHNAHRLLSRYEWEHRRPQPQRSVRQRREARRPIAAEESSR